MKKATRAELVELLDYVRANHEFCDCNQKCASCDRRHYCREVPENPACEGCQIERRIIAICEAEGLA